MKIIRQIIAIIGIVCGIIAISQGNKVLDMSFGSHQDSTVAFGADFYTYSYEAGARTANNVRAAAQILQNGFGYLLITLGLLECVYFSGKFFELLAKPAAPISAENSPIEPPAPEESEAQPEASLPESAAVVDTDTAPPAQE